MPAEVVEPSSSEPSLASDSDSDEDAEDHNEEGGSLPSSLAGYGKSKKFVDQFPEHFSQQKVKEAEKRYIERSPRSSTPARFHNADSGAK